MQTAVLEYILQYRVEIAVAYSMILVGSFWMISVHREYFLFREKLTLSVFPLVNLLAVSLFVYEDICHDMRRDIPTYL